MPPRRRRDEKPQATLDSFLAPTNRSVPATNPLTALEASAASIQRQLELPITTPATTDRELFTPPPPLPNPQEESLLTPTRNWGLPLQHQRLLRGLTHMVHTTTTTAPPSSYLRGRIRSGVASASALSTSSGGGKPTNTLGGSMPVLMCGFDDPNLPLQDPDEISQLTTIPPPQNNNRFGGGDNDDCCIFDEKQVSLLTLERREHEDATTNTIEIQKHIELVGPVSSSPPSYVLKKENITCGNNDFDLKTLSLNMPSSSSSHAPQLPPTVVASLERLSQWHNTSLKAFALTPTASSQSPKDATPRMLPPRCGLNWAIEGDNQRMIHAAIARGFRALNAPHMSQVFDDMDEGGYEWMLGFTYYDAAFNRATRQSSHSSDWVTVDPPPPNTNNEPPPPEEYINRHERLSDAGSGLGFTSDDDGDDDEYGFRLDHNYEPIPIEPRIRPQRPVVLAAPPPQEQQPQRPPPAAQPQEYAEAYDRGGADGSDNDANVATSEIGRFMQIRQCEETVMTLSRFHVQQMATNIDGSSRDGRYLLLHSYYGLVLYDMDPFVEMTGDGGCTLASSHPEWAFGPFMYSFPDWDPLSVLGGAVRLFSQQVVDRVFQSWKLVNHAITGSAVSSSSSSGGVSTKGRYDVHYRTLLDRIADNGSGNGGARSQDHAKCSCSRPRSSCGAVLYVDGTPTTTPPTLYVYEGGSEAMVSYSTLMNTFLSSSVTHLRNATDALYSPLGPQEAWEAIEGMLIGDGCVPSHISNRLPAYPGPAWVDPMGDGVLGSDPHLASQMKWWGDTIITTSPQSPPFPGTSPKYGDWLRYQQYVNTPRGRTLLAELSWERFVTMYLGRVRSMSVVLNKGDADSSTTTAPFRDAVASDVIFALSAAVEPLYVTVKDRRVVQDDNNNNNNCVDDKSILQKLEAPFKQQSDEEITIFNMWECVRQTVALSVAPVSKHQSHQWDTMSPSPPPSWPFMSPCSKPTELLAVLTKDGMVVLFNATKTTPTCRVSPRTIPASYGGGSWDRVEGRDGVRDAGSFWIHAPLARAHIPTHANNTAPKPAALSSAKTQQSATSTTNATLTFPSAPLPTATKPVSKSTGGLGMIGGTQQPKKVALLPTPSSTISPTSATASSPTQRSVFRQPTRVTGAFERAATISTDIPTAVPRGTAVLTLPVANATTFNRDARISRWIPIHIPNLSNPSQLLPLEERCVYTDVTYCWVGTSNGRLILYRVVIKEEQRREPSTISEEEDESIVVVNGVAMSASEAQRIQPPKRKQSFFSALSEALARDDDDEHFDVPHPQTTTSTSHIPLPSSPIHCRTTYALEVVIDVSIAYGIPTNNGGREVIKIEEATCDTDSDPSSLSTTLGVWATTKGGSLVRMEVSIPHNRHNHQQATVSTLERWLGEDSQRSFTTRACGAVPSLTVIPGDSLAGGGVSSPSPMNRSSRLPTQDLVLWSSVAGKSVRIVTPTLPISTSISQPICSVRYHPKPIGESGAADSGLLCLTVLSNVLLGMRGRWMGLTAATSKGPPAPTPFPITDVLSSLLHQLATLEAVLTKKYPNKKSSSVPLVASIRSLIDKLTKMAQGGMLCPMLSIDPFQPSAFHPLLLPTTAEQPETSAATKPHQPRTAGLKSLRDEVDTTYDNDLLFGTMGDDPPQQSPLLPKLDNTVPIIAPLVHYMDPLMELLGGCTVEQEEVPYGGGGDGSGSEVTKVPPLPFDLLGDDDEDEDAFEAELFARLNGGSSTKQPLPPPQPTPVMTAPPKTMPSSHPRPNYGHTTPTELSTTTPYHQEPPHTVDGAYNNNSVPTSTTTTPYIQSTTTTPPPRMLDHTLRGDGRDLLPIFEFHNSNGAFGKPMARVPKRVSHILIPPEQATKEDGRVPVGMLYMRRYKLLVMGFDLNNLVLFPL